MKLESLASRMEKVGCPIHPSAIYKIESAGRRITVDELVGFSEVFGIPVEELLLPPEVAATQELVQRITAWDAARVAAIRSQDEADALWARLQEYVQAHPEISEAVEAAVGAWTDFYYDSDDANREWILDHKIADLTGDRSRKEQAAAKFHEVIG